MLTDNRILGTRDGIYFYYANRNTVEQNVIQGTRYGLHYMYADDNKFYRNRFTGNTGGAALMLSKRIELKENEFSFSQGSQAFGLLLQQADNVQVVGNHFFQNQRALFLDQSQNSRFAGNQFTHNQVGVEVWASCNNLAFTENRFAQNTVPVISVGGQRSNKWSENRKGNDWGSEFPMLDLNQDGIGDAPVEYKSFRNQTAEHK